MGATLVSIDFDSVPCLTLLLLVKLKGRRHTGENAVISGIRRCGKGFASMLVILENLWRDCQKARKLAC